MLRSTLLSSFGSNFKRLFYKLQRSRSSNFSNRLAETNVGFEDTINWDYNKRGRICLWENYHEGQTMDVVSLNARSLKHFRTFVLKSRWCMMRCFWGVRADTCRLPLRPLYAVVSMFRDEMLLDSREIPIVPSPWHLYLRSDKTKSFPSCEEEESNLIVTTWVRAIINESLSFRPGSGPGPSSRNKTINDFYLYSFVSLVSWGGEGGGGEGPGSRDQVSSELCEKLAYFR